MKTKLRKLTAVTLLVLGAFAVFLYAYKVRNYPKTIITINGTTIYLGPKESVEMMEKLVTPDPDGMAHTSMRPDYEWAKADWDKRNKESISLIILGLWLLVCAAMIVRAGNQIKAIVEQVIVEEVEGGTPCVIQPRLNKGTYSLKEWIQVSLDLAGVPRDPVQGAFQAGRKFRLGHIVPVVRSLHPHIVPKRFDRIKFGAVLRQGAEVEAVAVAG
jgi:hypothetical protein